jgi:hypothetical protein
MRRFVTIPVVMVAVVLGAAVPALRAAAQLVDPRTDQLVVAGDQLVVAGDQLVVTADQLIGVLPVPGTTVELTGMLVDSACYLRAGKAATSGDHAKCAIVCAQKGGRVALVTTTGDVYMVIGIYTQDNNAKLLQLMNRPIVIAGMVGVRTPPVVVPVISSVDDRRPTGTEDGVLAKARFRQGDFKDGDLPTAPQATIEPTAFKLVQ